MKPKLRFKEFSGDWEEKRLGDIVTFLDGKRKPLEKGERISGEYPYYGASGIIDYVKDYIFDEELILLSEDGANIIDRNYRVCFLARGKYWVNNHAHVLKAKENNYNAFVCEALERLNYQKYNTGTAQPKLNQDVCKKIILNTPSLPEQTKIADFLSTVDEKIQNQQDKITHLENIKKGFMQKIFSRKIRFKDANGNDFPNWEETTIGKSGYFYYGKSAPKWSIKEDATTPCIRYGELYTTHNIIVKNIKSYTNIDKENLKFSKGNEVLVPRVGEEPLDFCKCCYLPFPNIAIGEMISVYNTENNPLFISYLFNATMKYEFARRVEGGNVSNLYFVYLYRIFFL